MAKLRPESFPMTSPGMRMAKNATQHLRSKAATRDKRQQVRSKLRPEQHQRPDQVSPEPIPTIGAPVKTTSTLSSDRVNILDDLNMNENYISIGQEGLPQIQAQEYVQPESPTEREAATNIPGVPTPNLGMAQNNTPQAGKSYNPATGQTTTNMDRGQQLVSKPKGFNRNMKKGGY